MLKNKLISIFMKACHPHCEIESVLAGTKITICESQPKFVRMRKTLWSFFSNFHLSWPLCV